MKWAGVAIILLRLFLGGLFIYASVDKIFNPAAFAEIIYNYRILSGALINIAAIVLPWLELILGLLLLAGRFMPGAILIGTTLLFFFWTALLFNLARGLDIHCGCFSTQSTEQGSMLWYTFRDTAFLGTGIALFILVWRRSKKQITLETT
ncbi:MAG: MauE/DoxX family redox-associated membrane protein [Pseudomonadota bacterium]